MSAEAGLDWLDLTRLRSEILAPAPAGSLDLVRDFPPADLAEVQGLFDHEGNG